MTVTRGHAVIVRLTADDALHEAVVAGGPDITDFWAEPEDIPKGMRLMFYPFDTSGIQGGAQ
jgi:hypothetical protein